MLNVGDDGRNIWWESVKKSAVRRFYSMNKASILVQGKYLTC